MLVPYSFFRFPVIQYSVMNAGISLGITPARCALPNNFIAKVRPSENRIHNGFQVMTGRGIAMQIDRARRLEQSPHFKQSHGHETHEGSHAIRVRIAGTFDGFHQSRIVIGDLVHPFLMYITLPRPAILELGSGCQTVRRSMEVSALVEGRISGDQVYGFRVHGPHELEIIAVEKSTIRPVRFHAELCTRLVLVCQI